MENIKKKHDPTISTINVMLQMRSKINSKVTSHLPPISNANESKTSRQNATREQFQELEAGRCRDGFKEIPQNNKYSKSPLFEKNNLTSSGTKYSINKDADWSTKHTNFTKNIVGNAKMNENTKDGSPEKSTNKNNLKAKPSNKASNSDCISKD